VYVTQGTGKALRRLVVSGRVVREGKGGVGDPFRYRYSTDSPVQVAPSEAAVAGQASAAAATAAAAAATTAKASAARDAGARGKKGSSKVSDDKDRAQLPRKRGSPSAAGNNEAAAGKGASGRARLTVAGIEAGDIDFSAETAPFAALLHHDHDDSHEHAPHPPSNPMSVAVEDDREADARAPHAVVAVAPFTPKWARKYRAAGGNRSPQSGGVKSPTSPAGGGAGKSGVAADTASSTAARAAEGRAGSRASCIIRRAAPAGVCIDDSLDADAADNARCPYYVVFALV